MWDCYDELRMMSVFRETEGDWETWVQCLKSWQRKELMREQKRQESRPCLILLKILYKSWDGQQSRQWKQ